MDYDSMNIRLRATGEDAREILAMIASGQLPEPSSVNVVGANDAPQVVANTVAEESVAVMNQTYEEAKEPAKRNGLFDADRGRSRWDRGEEAILMRLLLNGSTVEEVAQTLGRTIAAVKARISRLGINFQKVRSERTDAVITNENDITSISVHNPVLREFVYAFVEANRENYPTMMACLEAAASQAGCSVATIKRIHYPPN